MESALKGAEQIGFTDPLFDSVADCCVNPALFMGESRPIFVSLQ